MTCDWTPLRTALAACRRDGVAVPFWWRDDDAIAPTAALDHLSHLSMQTGVRVHLAVIPGRAEPTLVDAIMPAHMIPVVHGWMHRDHSGAGEKKNEFMTRRAGAQGDTHTALTQMRALFGAAARAMFVPPWNRINAACIDALAPQGYDTLSTFGPRAAENAAPGLRQINTHADPIHWKGNRDLVDPATLIAQTAAHLDARRTGVQDAHEPFGLLTHHLMHTPAIWSFVAAYVQEMTQGGATPWVMENER